MRDWDFFAASLLQQALNTTKEQRLAVPISPGESEQTLARRRHASERVYGAPQ
jgi:hypothetical protein